MRCRIFGAVGLLTASVVVMAPTPAAFAGGGLVDEVKLGVLDHDIPLFSSGVESGIDINGEARFRAIDWFASKNNSAWLNDLLSPRPNIGLSVNTAGNTDFYYVGLTWTADFANNVFQPSDGLFADFGFGGAVQDGHLENAPPGEKSLGSRGLFHLSGELGYRFNPSVSLSVYYDHYSNAGLASPNPGINDVGMRLGYRF